MVPVITACFRLCSICDADLDGRDYCPICGAEDETAGLDELGDDSREVA
jgi:hypothetical protein